MHRQILPAGREFVGPQSDHIPPGGVLFFSTGFPAAGPTAAPQRGPIDEGKREHSPSRANMQPDRPHPFASDWISNVAPCGDRRVAQHLHARQPTTVIFGPPPT